MVILQTRLSHLISKQGLIVLTLQAGSVTTYCYSSGLFTWNHLFVNFLLFWILPWPKTLRQPRIRTLIGRCLIVWYCARSLTISAQRIATERDFCPALVIEHIKQCSLKLLSTSWFSTVSIFLARVVLPQVGRLVAEYACAIHLLDVCHQ